MLSIFMFCASSLLVTKNEAIQFLCKSELHHPKVLGDHSISNEHKKILIPTDLNENWFLHSVC